MKTAEEDIVELKEILNHWIFTDVQDNEDNDETILKWMKDKKLDAIKHGMTKAVEINRAWSVNKPGSSENVDRAIIDIVTARDSMKEVV